MLFIQNKYTKWYFKIVDNAKNRNLDKNIYTETHHIIPRCMDGDNSKNNLVKLTAREHFVCHLLLVKMTVGQYRYKMLSAVTRFQQVGEGQQRELTSWEYKRLRECAIEARTGVRHSNESRKKISDNHHNVSGSNNPRAKHIKVEYPNGETKVIHGILKQFCKDNEISYNTIIKMLRTKTPTMSGSAVGWYFSYVD